MSLQLAQGEAFNADPAISVMAGDVICNPLKVTRIGAVIQFELSGGTAWTDCLVQASCGTDKDESFAWDMQVFIT